MLARKQTETPRPASLIGLRILLSRDVIKRFLPFGGRFWVQLPGAGGLACTRFETGKLLFINELQHDSRSPQFFRSPPIAAPHLLSPIRNAIETLRDK
jgi:hypothetical protein